MISWIGALSGPISFNLFAAVPQEFTGTCRFELCEITISAISTT